MAAPTDLIRQARATSQSLLPAKGLCSTITGPRKNNANTFDK